MNRAYALGEEAFPLPTTESAKIKTGASDFVASHHPAAPGQFALSPRCTASTRRTHQVSSERPPRSSSRKERSTFEAPGLESKNWAGRHPQPQNHDNSNINSINKQQKQSNSSRAAAAPSTPPPAATAAAAAAAAPASPSQQPHQRQQYAAIAAAKQQQEHGSNKTWQQDHPMKQARPFQASCAAWASATAAQP